MVKTASGSSLIADDFGGETMTYLTRYDVHLQPQDMAPSREQNVITAPARKKIRAGPSFDFVVFAIPKNRLTFKWD